MNHADEEKKHNNEQGHYMHYLSTTQYFISGDRKYTICVQKTYKNIVRNGPLPANKFNPELLVFTFHRDLIFPKTIDDI